MKFLLKSNLLAVGLRLFTEANDGGFRGKVYLILSNALCMRMDVLLNSQ
jgi:hypothetical protein